MDSREPPAAAPPHAQQLQPPQPGMIVGPPPNSYAPNTNMIHNNSTTNAMHNPSFPFDSLASSASQPLNSQNYGDGLSPSLRPGGGFGIDSSRKKRGRPRKFSPDNNNISLGLTTPTPITTISSVAYDETSGGTPSGEPTAKRCRGRPPGSGKKQMDALGSAGVSFTPHVIIVDAGEDIAAKLMAFSQQGPRTICILSANGAVCNVTLSQSAISGGTVTYEGQFEIISLSGSYLLSEGNGNHSKTGGLSVSLAGSDGRVLGGVAGMLMAATSVQVIVGSFIADGKRSKSGPTSEQFPNMLNFGGLAVAASPPEGASSESSEESGDSPPNHTSGPYVNVNQPVQDMPMYANMGWANTTMKIFPN